MIPLTGLRVVQKLCGSARGVTAVCESRNGTYCVCVTIREETCGRAFLPLVDDKYPYRMHEGELEVQFPFRQGESVTAWEARQEPDFAARRALCLRLLEWVAAEAIPAQFLALMTDLSALVIGEDGPCLQYRLELERWEPGERDAAAYSSLGLLLFEVLNREVGMNTRNKMLFPAEYRLLHARAEAGGYRSFAGLYEDVKALPDTLEVKSLLRPPKLRLPPLPPWLIRGTVALAVLVLTVLAAVSGYDAYRRMDEQKAPVYPGVTQVGDQHLGGSP